jgi:two-component system alkaline phosphatase synthesis response regulator PhoP
MIYLLEDDPSIRELVVYTLSNSGLETIGFEKPSDFWSAMRNNRPELLLLDIMLPEEDGLHILRKLRDSKDTQTLPVIMLTAKSNEYDKVLGLEQGADDYIAKPFGMMEMVARVKAVLRRSKMNYEEKVDKKAYQIDGLYLCPASHVVRNNNEEVPLTAKEFELLCYLVENAGVVLSRTQILEHIWGYEFDGESRTVDVHVGTLRQKLKEYGEYIETIRGFGYKFKGYVV